MAERSSPVRNDSTTTTTRGAPPKIELDFGEGAAERSTRGSALQATGIGLYSPITGDVSARPTDAELCNGNGKQPCVISGAEAELLRETKFTWAQVERAWNVAGQEVKVVGKDMHIEAKLNLSILLFRLEDGRPLWCRI